MNQELAGLAQQDFLTGLANRRLLAGRNHWQRIAPRSDFPLVSGAGADQDYARLSCLAERRCRKIAVSSPRWHFSPSFSPASAQPDPTGVMKLPTTFHGDQHAIPASLQTFPCCPAQRNPCALLFAHYTLCSCIGKRSGRRRGHAGLRTRDGRRRSRFRGLQRPCAGRLDGIHQSRRHDPAAGHAGGGLGAAAVGQHQVFDRLPGLRPMLGNDEWRLCGRVRTAGSPAVAPSSATASRPT
jgi:hypothetical protein